MNKIVKYLSIICASCMLSSALAGCASRTNSVDTKGTDNSSKQEEPAKPVSMRFSWWGGDARHKATLAALDLYKQKFPNVTIDGEYQGIDGYLDKLKTQLASNSAPDIIQVDIAWYPELTSRGDYFVDLETQKVIDTKGFDEKFLKDFGVYNNKLKAIPLGVNGLALIYNKTFCDKYGIPTNVKWDWDMVISEGKKLHEKDNKLYLFNSDLGLINLIFDMQLVQKVGDRIKDDYTIAYTKQDVTEVFDYIKKAYEVGVFQPLGESYLFNGKIEQNPKWINQQTAFIPEWSSGVAKYKSALPKETEVAVMLPPVLKAAKDTGVRVRPSQLVSINNKSANVAEAAKFINWFVNDKEAAVALGDVRSVPAVEAARNAIVSANKLDKAVADAVDIASKNSGKPQDAMSGNSQIGDIQQDIIQKVVYGKLTPAQGADELLKKMNDKLKELKEAKK